MHIEDDDEAFTIEEACLQVGGKNNPISKPTYYRGVKKGIFPAPYHPSPGISRVSRNKLIAALRARKAM